MRPLFPSKRAMVRERDAWRVSTVTALIGYVIGDLPEPDWLPLKVVFTLILFVALAWFVGADWMAKHGEDKSRPITTADLPYRPKEGRFNRCPTCGGTDREGGTVATSGPDEFGNYDTDDCPDLWHEAKATERKPGPLHG